MTTRKPSNMSFPDWIERQIRTAEAEGAFDNLAGAGKPIPDIDRPQHELAWVADYLRRESGNVTEVLPPALALAKEVEVLPERLLKQRSEADVRAVVAHLNQRIARAHAQPQVGPPVRVKLVDVESAVQRWREAVAARAATVPLTRPEPAPPVHRRMRRRARSR